MATLQDLMRQVASNSGGYFESTTTTVGASATNIIDVASGDRSVTANAFRSWWFQSLSAQNSGEVRMISDSTTSGYTLSRGTTVAMPVGARYALYRHNPTDITAAINAAIRETNGVLYEHVIDESTVVDDIGRNSSFEESRTALLFDAADDQVSVAASSIFEDHFAGGGTITAWIYPFSDGEGSVGTIINSGAGATKGYAFYVANESNGYMLLKGYFYHDSVRGEWSSVERILPINRWSKIAVTHTWDDVDNNPSVYHAVEGEPLKLLAMRELTTPVGAGTSDTGVALTFGGNGAGSYTWDGLLANIQYWNKERPQYLIEEYMNKDTIDPAAEPDLVGWWLTERGAFTVAIDASGNSNSGTISGALWVESFKHWTFGGIDPTSSLRAINLNEMIHGKSSAKLTSSSGGTAQYRQFIDTQGAQGSVLHQKRWVRADAASSARIGVGGTGVTTTYSDYHTGGGQWELLTVDYTLTTGDIDMYLICEAAVSLVGYFGYGWSWIDRQYHYPLPAGMVRPSRVSVQASESRPSGGFVPLNGYGPRSGAILRIEGQRPLPTLESASDVLPLEEPYVSLLVTKATGILFDILASRASGDARSDFQDDAARAHRSYEDMARDPRRRMPRLGTVPSDAYHVEGSTLVLDR